MANIIIPSDSYNCEIIANNIVNRNNKRKIAKYFVEYKGLS